MLTELNSDDTKFDQVVIGITGYKGIGKTTLAEAIRQEASSYSKISFADPVYETVFALVKHADKPTDFIGGNSALKGTQFSFGSMKFSGRELLQMVGVEILRKQLGEDILVNIMRTKVNSRALDNLNIVIDDVRMLNEAEFILRHPRGFLIKLIDDDYVNKDTHLTETSVDTILNLSDPNRRILNCQRKAYENTPIALATAILNYTLLF